MDEKLLLMAMLHKWRERERESNMSWLCFGLVLVYYVATISVCECSVCVNGQGCSVGDDAGKSHK